MKLSKRKQLLTLLSCLVFITSSYANEGGKILAGVGSVFMLFLIFFGVLLIPVIIFRQKKVYLIFSIINFIIAAIAMYQLIENLEPSAFMLLSFQFFMQLAATITVIMLNIQSKREQKLAISKTEEVLDEDI